MNVLMISPGYPSEMPFFTRGLADVGARVFGVGDQPAGALEPSAREALHDYLQVSSLWDSDAVISEVRRWLYGKPLHRVECLWEPFILLAARLREAFGISGMRAQRASTFRDKEEMKRALDVANIRTPRHFATTSIAGCWEASKKTGFPLIIKPIDGAGSADTYRIDDADGLRSVLPRLRHVPCVSVEEFVDGDEYTFDAITINNKVAYFNVAWYRPRPLIARSNEWVSPQVIALRDVDAPELRGGVEMGHEVIKALGFECGFTHMEWYRKADGEVVFGEIGARPPGARQVDQMNYACDIDVFREWARAVTHGQFGAQVERRYNVATIYKRALGVGQIRHIEGLQEIYQKYGAHIVSDTLLRPGAQRRDWRNTLISDGYIILRHPDLAETLKMADAVGEEVRMYAS